jgi:hypothetical protein
MCIYIYISAKPVASIFRKNKLSFPGLSKESVQIYQIARYISEYGNSRKLVVYFLGLDKLVVYFLGLHKFEQLAVLYENIHKEIQAEPKDGLGPDTLKGGRRTSSVTN